LERIVDISKDAIARSVVRIAGDSYGPRVVMFSGVHGDELSGIHAIEKLFFDLFAGTRTLKRGSLILVRANEYAMAHERRYVKYNLNRIFREDYGPEIDRSQYEFVRVQELKPLLKNCDYFLDFHSAPIAREPFLIAEKRCLKFYSKLGIPRIITGWSNFSGGAIGGDAENYANAQGAVSATLESGSHFDKSANDVAYRTAVSLLSLLGMVEPTEEPLGTHTDIFEMHAVVTKDADDFQYVGQVQNFQFIKANDAFAFQGGVPLRVSEDSYLLIPMKPQDTKIREEVCYLGRKLGDA
jgi:uncharacterized protein